MTSVLQLGNPIAFFTNDS